MSLDVVSPYFDIYLFTISTDDKSGNIFQLSGHSLTVSVSVLVTLLSGEIVAHLIFGFIWDFAKGAQVFLGPIAPVCSVYRSQNIFYDVSPRFTLFSLS